jgi:4-amino-4-deoxy-L-arabinose transferase-like glycosyltransferase
MILGSPDSLHPEATSENAGGITAGQPGVTDFVALAAIALIFIFFSVYDWGHWGDLQIDCGREVYIPVEILKGRMLYRDLYYPYGPLVPYLQAILVWCFGVHLSTFYCFGLFLNLTITCLVYGLARRFIPPTAALVVAIACLRQGFRESVSNYVFPYSYAAVVGLVLALVSIYLLLEYLDERADRKLVLAGLAAGLALLCKQEFGAAVLLTVGFTMIWDVVTTRSFAALLHQTLMIAPGLLLAALVYAWFFWRLTPDFMLRENFTLSPNSTFMKTIGPRWIADAGFRFVPKEMFTTFAGVVFSLGVWFFGAWLFSRAVGSRWMLPASACILILVLIGGASHSHLAHIPAHLAYLVTFPIGMYWIAPVILIAAIAGLPRAADRRTRCAVALLAVFASALAMRVMFRIAREGYSIYYDPPLFILFMMAVTGVVCLAARRLDRTARLHLINSFLAIDAMFFLLVPFPGRFWLTAPVKTPIGTIFSQPAEAALVPQMISFVREQAAAGKRVLILPEFPMLYVMGGTEAPSRWYELFPGLLDSADESRFIADAESQHVEYVIITNRAMSKYGYPYFGIDWGKNIYGWINSNFEQSSVFGNFERKTGAPFAALVYKRRTIPAQTDTTSGALNR